MSDPLHEPTPAVQRAADFIRDAKKGVALTGAGISTPSGIPDFRSAGSGLWTRYEPMEVASLSVFRCQPEKFYTWLRPLASQIVAAHPNPAHQALARLEERRYIKTLITQNIDGLHHRAGSHNVLEVHGTLYSLTCVGCFRHYPAEEIIESYITDGKIPHCPICGSILKPDAILYEEQLPERTWRQAEEASKTCDLMLVAGTSLEVMPSAGLPMRAVEHGAHLIVVNRTPTYIDDRADVLLKGDVAEVLPRLAAEVIGE